AAGVTAVTLRPDGGAAPAPAVPGNALLVAAASAQKAPAGRYWHARSVLGEIYAVGAREASHYRIDSRQGNDLWFARDGRGSSAHLDLPDVPVTARDRQRWQAAGSPGMVKIPNSEGGGGDMLLEMNPSAQTGPRMPTEGGWHGLTVDQIAKLPTEPGALRNALLDLRGNWRARSSTARKEPIRALSGQERVRALSEVAGTLLSTAPAPPRVRAATFRMLAALPGVRPEGGTTDPQGRPGTAVSLPLETTVPLGLYTAPKQLGTYRRQFIIDPAAGRLLAIRDLVVKPPRGSRPLPPGDDGRPRRLEARDLPDRFHKPGELAGYQIFEVSEWTDAEPPAGALLPPDRS
ncbi:CU044_5270 family protein, partial [Actinomadura kijaniata]|uniref:CU044_5270 family protein n=1 Tax=Actinomadura kijaniata TaxID=46161 RepID=UPI0008332A12